MIDSQKIHEALSLLPEDLIAPVDALRRKKQIPWKSLTALAACFCLCVGLWFFFPDTRAENAAGSAPENSNGLAGEMTEHSISVSLKEWEVYSVAEDHIDVVPVSNIELSDEFCVQIAVTTVTFENLKTVPELKPGQHIRIYYDLVDNGSNSISPYRIEIIKEEEK